MKRFTKYFYFNHSSLKTNTCVYCGDYANSKDHVPAISIADLYPSVKKLIVRSCSLCNSLLSNRHYSSLKTRAEYLLVIYPKRFKKIIDSPTWTLKEINEYKGILKRTLIKNFHKKESIIKKIYHLENLILNFNPENEL